MQEIIANIKAGKYQTDAPPLSREEYSTPSIRKSHAEKCRELTNAAEALFKKDILEAYGVQDHPKANDAYELAWVYGHSAGHQEVLSYFDDLVDLLK